MELTKPIFSTEQEILLLTTTHIIWLLPKYNFLMRHSELVMLWSTKSVWSLQYGPNHLLTPLFVSVYKCMPCVMCNDFHNPPIWCPYSWLEINQHFCHCTSTYLKIEKNNHWINFWQIHDNPVLPRF